MSKDSLCPAPGSYLVGQDSRLTCRRKRGSGARAALLGCFEQLAQHLGRRRKLGLSHSRAAVGAGAPGSLGIQRVRNAAHVGKRLGFAPLRFGNATVGSLDLELRLRELNASGLRGLLFTLELVWAAPANAKELVKGPSSQAHSATRLLVG